TRNMSGVGGRGRGSGVGDDLSRVIYDALQRHQFISSRISRRIENLSGSKRRLALRALIAAAAMQAPDRRNAGERFFERIIAGKLHPLSLVKLGEWANDLDPCRRSAVERVLVRGKEIVAGIGKGIAAERT